MGCAASAEVGDAPISASGGRVELFSDASHAFLGVKVKGGNKSFGDVIVKDKTGNSKSLVESFGLGKAKPLDLRYWTESEFPKFSTTPKASGDITLGDDGCLSMMLGTHMPLAAPIAKQKALGSMAVICPVVYTVDLYVTIDGEAQVDGHVCCGDATLDKAASIAHAVDKVVDGDHEEAIRKLLEEGPPPGAGSPWATLVSEKFKTEAFVHLPLIFQGNVDDATLPESESYGGALLAKFSELCAKTGPGKHDWEIRVAPRGVIAGGDVCEGVGGFKGGGTQGIGLSMADYYNGDSGFKALLDDKLDGQYVAANIPGLTASISLELPEKLCKGGGGERLAPEFNTGFAQDIDEHCAIAYGLAATGPARGAVSKVLDGAVGKAAHIIIPVSDLAGGITEMASQGGREGGTRFFATALFHSADPDEDDALGAMVKFVCAKYERRNYKDVGDPKWECEGTFGNSRDKCAAFPIKNKQIKAAIARDETVWGVASLE
jgi:hypothetical protein